MPLMTPCHRYLPFLLAVTILLCILLSNVRLTSQQGALLISNFWTKDHLSSAVSPITYSSADIVGSLVTGDSGSASRWTRSWIPGVPGEDDERSRLQAAYTSLFVKVVSRIGLDLSPSGSGECPFTNGMDEWTPLKYRGRAETMFQSHTSNKTRQVRADEAMPFGGSCGGADVSKEYATKPPTPAEISGSERIFRLYSLYREEIHATLSAAPITFFSNACLLTYPTAILASCLTAATLAATSSELSRMKESTFSIFSSIGRFCNTVCAHSLPCNVWRTGHWDVQPVQNTTSPRSTTSTSKNVAATFASIFTATVGPSNPHSGRDIRRLREHRSTLFPWKTITLTHPRFRALRVGNENIEFNVSRGVFTAQTEVDGSVRAALDLPPNELFQRILKVSRSVEGNGRDIKQRFPSLITFDGDSLYRGLFYSSIQRLREHGLGTTTTYPLDANMYDVLPPVPSTGTHNEAVYFMYPTPTGVVDVLAERWTTDNPGTDPPPTAEAIRTFRQQRRKLAEVLGVLAKKDPVRTQQLVIKFLSSTMIAVPPTTVDEGSGGNNTATYAHHVLLGYESGAEAIIYAHIICGAQQGTTFPPSFACPIVILQITFTSLQQNIFRNTWPPESMASRKALYHNLTSSNQWRRLGLDPVYPAMYDVTRIGMRVHGVGSWMNNFDDAVINAAALSSADVPDPPIIINRLTTTHSRCCHRESCAQTRMREGSCNTSTMTTTASVPDASSIKGICVLQPPSQPGGSVRRSWDAIPDDFLRYEYIATQLKNSRKQRRKGVATLRGEYMNTQAIVENNFRFDTLGRVMTLLWEAAVDTNTTNTLLEDWCKSTEDGPQNPIFQNVGKKTIIHLLAPICGAPTRYTNAVRSTLGGRSNTVFLDALLLRSLLPFGSTDFVHYDCSMHIIPHDRPQVVHETLQFLQAFPGLFSFPNNSLHSLKSTSQSMCSTLTIDAAGLASLLYSAFPDHFTLPDDIRTLQSAMPTFWEGSMFVGVPTSGTDDSCRSTLPRSELSLIFGDIVK